MKRLLSILGATAMALTVTSAFANVQETQTQTQPTLVELLEPNGPFAQ
jgi:hypothetical protein